VDQLLRGIADDWHSTRDIGERLAKAKTAGASWRLLAYRTGIPITTVRRWAAPHLDHEPATGGAVPPRPTATGLPLNGQGAVPSGPALGS
jgi:hypothetical protein